MLRYFLSSIFHLMIKLTSQIWVVVLILSESVKLPSIIDYCYSAEGRLLNAIQKPPLFIDLLTEGDA